jgi:hypothetical protein
VLSDAYKLFNFLKYFNMTNFFYNDYFYSELIELIEQEGWELEDVLLFDDDFTLTANDARSEKIIKFDAEWITSQIEDRFPEDAENQFDQVYKIFNDNIDFKKINELLPENWYMLRKTFKITKADLIEALS